MHALPGRNHGHLIDDLRDARHGGIRIGAAPSGEYADLIHTQDPARVETLPQVVHAALELREVSLDPLFALRGSVSLPTNRLEAGNANLHQAGIEEGDANAVLFKQLGLGVQLIFRQIGIFLVLPRNIAQFHPAQSVLFREVDSRLRGPGDLVGNGADTGNADAGPGGQG